MTRRQLVALFGATAASAAAHHAVSGQAAPATLPATTPATTPAPNCIAIPQQTEGPYFVDEKLLRSDVRQDPSTGKLVPGTPLDLRMHVSSINDAGVCTPLAGAMVDIWQCDAAGVYSDVRDNNFDTRGQKFLRGYQVSDASGLVRFTTIYPGWYPGRAVHIHFKVRTNATGTQPASEFISQFYFDEAMTDRIHAREPYASHRGQRLRNERDMIYREGGAQLMLAVNEAGQALNSVYAIAMRPGTQPPRDQFGPGRPGGPGRGRGRG